MSSYTDRLTDKNILPQLHGWNIKRHCEDKLPVKPLRMTKAINIKSCRMKPQKGNWRNKHCLQPA